MCDVIPCCRSAKWCVAGLPLLAPFYRFAVIDTDLRNVAVSRPERRGLAGSNGPLLRVSHEALIADAFGGVPVNGMRGPFDIQEQRP